MHVCVYGNIIKFPFQHGNEQTEVIDPGHDKDAMVEDDTSPQDNDIFSMVRLSTYTRVCHAMLILY